MADRPILFSAPMIRALIDGRKTQTRRIIKPQPPADVVRHCWYAAPIYGFTTEKDVTDKWYTVRLLAGPEDRLWVREAFANIKDDPHCDLHKTCADYAYRATDDDEFTIPPKWKPSIHMPRHVSRLTLTVTDVRVERLQDITEADAIAEGIAKLGQFYGVPESALCFASVESAIDGYATLWDSINGDGAWAANPWVAAYTFTVHHGNIDQVPS